MLTFEKDCGGEDLDALASVDQVFSRRVGQHRIGELLHDSRFLKPGRC